MSANTHHEILQKMVDAAPEFIGTRIVVTVTAIDAKLKRVSLTFNILDKDGAALYSLPVPHDLAVNDDLNIGDIYKPFEVRLEA